MASKEELEALGISDNHNMNDRNNSVIQTNAVAKIIKILAIVVGVVGVLFGIISIDALNSGEMAVFIILLSVISAVFIYALGEIIQLLQDIKNK